MAVRQSHPGGRQHACLGEQGAMTHADGMVMIYSSKRQSPSRGTPSDVPGTQRRISISELFLLPYDFSQPGWLQQKDMLLGGEGLPSSSAQPRSWDRPEYIAEQNSIATLDTTCVSLLPGILL